jgi:hypothetical protein
MTIEDLQGLRDWADAKVTAGRCPLWAWYQYVKLREALDGVVAAMTCAGIQIESPLPSYVEIEPRIVVSNTRPDNGWPHTASARPRVDRIGAGHGRIVRLEVDAALHARRR